MSSLGVSVGSFPLATLGIPIATVCPQGTNPSTSSFSFTDESDADVAGVFRPIYLPTTSLIASSVITASAKLPDGSMTIFSSLTKREVEQAAAPDLPFILPDGNTAIQLGNGSSFDTATGKIIIGTEGCQTLYTPTVTAICSTIISPVGIAPVTVTDCEQYITFSSETFFTCDPTPTVSPLPLDNGNSTVSTFNPLGASITRTSTPSNTPVTSSDITRTGPADAPAAASSNADMAMPTSTGSVTFSAEATESAAPFARRDITYLSVVYTTVPNADVSISLPRHLLEENQLRKRYNELENRRREIMIVNDLNITIATSMTVQKTTIVRTISTVPNIELSPAITTTNNQDTMKMTGDATLSVMQSLPSAINTDAEESTDKDVDATTSAMELLSIPAGETTAIAMPSTLPEVFMPIVGEPSTLSLSDSFLPTASVSSPPSTSDTPTSTSLIMDFPMPTASDASTSTPSEPSPPTVSDLSLLTTSELTNVMSSSAMPTSSAMTTDLPVHAIKLSAPQPTKYYLAPWYELVNGNRSVPTNVKGLTCYGGLQPVQECVTPNTDGNTQDCECDIDEEIWSVTSITLTRVGTTVVSFDGSVVMTASGYSLTTSVSVSQVLTTTAEIVVGSVAKTTITSSASGDDATVDATATTFPSVTITMLPGDGTSRNGSANITASVQGVSSVVDAAAPQNSPASLIESASLSMSVETSLMNTEIDGTVFVTSVVATETVTVQPSDQTAASESGGASLSARDSWATDVWMADTVVAFDAVE